MIVTPVCLQPELPERALLGTLLIAFAGMLKTNLIILYRVW
jgi:hypothetical protein